MKSKNLFSQNVTLACTLFIQMSVGMVKPPAHQLIIDDPQFPQRLIALPGDLLREMLFMNAKFYNGTNVHALAKGFLALACTNKALSTHMKNTGMRIGIANKLPYTMGAVYFAQKITYMPGNQFKEIPRWLKSSSERFRTLKISQLHAKGVQLLKAIENGDQAAIDTCFSFQNLPLNYSVNNSGLTPLMEAARNNHYEVAKRLLAAGANPNVRLKGDGNFALFDAAHCNQLDFIELLIAGGAKVTMQNINGETALMRLVKMRSYIEANHGGDALKTIRFLLTAGANVNLRCRDGATALMCAAGEEDIEVVQLLLEAGADPDLKLENAENPRHRALRAVDCARKNNQEELVAILEAASAAKQEKIANKSQ
jgi:ankyrin repeat protein